MKETINMSNEVSELHEASVALIFEMLQPEVSDTRRAVTRQAVADLILAHTGVDVTEHKRADVDPASLGQLLTPKQSASIAVMLRKLQGIGAHYRAAHA
jgi:hypothetical protein